MMDLVDIRVSTLTLPYHYTSWWMAKLLPYLNDLCDSEGTCKQNEYATLCFNDWTTNRDDENFQEFVDTWPKYVAEKLSLPDVKEMEQVYSAEDKHNSE